MIATGVFITSAILIIYHHALFPVLLARLARVAGRNHADASNFFSAGARSVCMIVPAYNEERFIAAKIENCDALEYPSGKLHILIVLDGCSDRTHELANRALKKASNPARFRLIENPSNLGKVRTLNESMNKTSADIVAFSDVSAMITADALVRCSRHMEDPNVGVVCGRYQIRQGTVEEQAYWNYQSELKKAEAAIAAPMGAHGAFYAIRGALWVPLDEATINDDFLIPMRIVDLNYRAVLDPEIEAVEFEPTALNQDLRRRVRIGAGNVQQVIALKSLANPTRPALAFVFVSGKGLRAFMPFIMLAAMLSVVVLALQYEPLFAALLALVPLALALTTYAFFETLAVPRPVRLLNYALAGYAAAGWGGWLYLMGRGDQLWRQSKLGRPSGDETSSA